MGPDALHETAEFIQNNWKTLVPVAVSIIALGWGWISPVISSHQKFKETSKENL